MCDNDAMIYDEDSAVDPLGDQENLVRENSNKNYAKVGSARGSTLLYTYGPGAIMDLPHFTVMPMGLDDWERIWKRRTEEPAGIHAPRLLETVQIMLGYQVKQLRPFPWQPNRSGDVREGRDLGVPARVFPQWLRCTGCDKLAPLSDFVKGYRNTNPYRPDKAEFLHKGCPGRNRGKGKSARRVDRPCIPARYLLVCPNGHVDEFPYDWWVHRGGKCEKADNPCLKMFESTSGNGGSVIRCGSCGQYRGMGEAQSEENRSKLPKCRGRHPHLNAFDPHGCDQEVRLMLIGASNLWFPVVQSIIDMPALNEEDDLRQLYEQIRAALGDNFVHLLDDEHFEDHIDDIRTMIRLNSDADDQLKKMTPVELITVVNGVRQLRGNEEERQRRKASWEPNDLLVPEWKYLDRDFSSERCEDKKSGLTVHTQTVAPDTADRGIRRILAVDRLRKVNAMIGFTRIDDYERANDLGSRLVKLTRDGRPKWVPATQDRGEGMVIQFDEDMVREWEDSVERSDLWQAHRQAHVRNFNNRFSQTAKDVDPDDRLPAPRYWLVHTFSHVLIKRMAMSAGYGIASLSERIYAWKATDTRPSAAGVLIATTASDSDGTLGGLVALSDEERFAQIMRDALLEARRCSSDPVCARRVPKDPEDFLHGAACHCCCMLSETCCERANRFLDRRFLVSLPGEYSDLAFFKDE